MAGVDEGHFVNVLAEFWKNGGDHLAALTARGELEGRLHERADGVGEEAGVFVEAGEFLAVHFLELRFVIPGVDLAGASVNEEPDDGFGLAIEVAFLCGEGVGGVCAEESFLGEEAGEAEAAEASSSSLEPVAPGVLIGMNHGR